MCDHYVRDEGWKAALMSHARVCYPRTTAYIALVVTVLLVLAILDAAGVF